MIGIAIVLQRTEETDIKGLEQVCRVWRKEKYNNVASFTPLRLQNQIKIIVLRRRTCDSLASPAV